MSYRKLPSVIATGDTVIFTNRAKDHKAGSSLVIGMVGTVLRVIPSAELANPNPGETCRVQCSFETWASGSFTEWLGSGELTVVRH